MSQETASPPLTSLPPIGSWEWRACQYRQTVDRNQWIPETPHAKNRLFLLLTDITEVFYGGAAGGGKTWGTLAAAAQYVNVPNYAALLLRENYGDLNQPEAWIPLSKKWWMNSEAEWSESAHRWTFPNGSTITFGYLSNDNAVYQYDTAAFQFIAIDELTQHSEWRYQFMFGRMRRPKEGPLSQVPIRMRAASNPGNKGHEWVKKRFVDPKTRPTGVLFVPANLSDNPYIDADSYRRDSLAKLDPITRKQREDGDWDAFAGGRFNSDNFRYTVKRGEYCVLLRQAIASNGVPIVKEEYCEPRKLLRFLTVDPASSTSEASDYTVISAWCISPWSDLVWLGCDRFKSEIPDIIPRLQANCIRWKPSFVGIEAVYSNRAVLQLAQRASNPAMACRPLDPGGKDKLVFATGAINLVAAGRVFMPSDDPTFPLDDVRSELTLFTGDEKVDPHDDIVSTLSYAAEIHTTVPSGAARMAAPMALGGRS